MTGTIGTCGSRTWRWIDRSRVTRVVRAVAFVALVVTQPCVAQLPCSYELSAVIQAPSVGNISSPTRATAISPNGRYVVGWFNPGGFGFDRGYWYDKQTKQFNPLPFLPGTFISYAMDVSDAGLIVGEIGGTAGDWGFVFDVATQQYTLLPPIDPLGACRATGINAAGQVCGWRSIGSKGDPTWPWNAFVWTESGGIIDLGVMNGPLSVAIGISEDGTVFGYSGGGAIVSDARGFLWKQGQLTLLPPVPGALNSVVRAVLNEDHLVLSAVQVVNGVQRARGFVTSRSEYANLGVLPGWDHTFAWNVDQQGQVIGGCASAANGATFAFVWRDGRLIPFDSLVVSGNAVLGEAQDVSTAGVIVGTGDDSPGEVVGLVFAPVPNRKGDTNCDRVVNVTDLLHVIGRWGHCDACSPDVDGDRDVDAFDLIEVILNWG